MDMAIPIFVICGVASMMIVPSLGMINPNNLPQEMLLKQSLLTNYDKTVRSAFNKSTPTDVYLEIALQMIIDVDEKKQLLLSTLWIRLFWTDEYLAWTPEDYGDIDHIKLPAHSIWVPDICLYEALDPAIHAKSMQDFFISADSDGSLMWLAPIVVTTVCDLNVRLFPYDTQSCKFEFASWVYHGMSLDLWNNTPVGDMDNAQSNVEWEVERFTVERTVTKFSCCPEPYPIVTYTLVMRRRPGFYVTYLYLPSVVIIASSLFAFHLPPGSDSKVDLAVTGLLSQTVFLLIISDLMPPDALNSPVLGECLTMLLMVQAVAVAVIVVIKRIHDDSIYKTAFSPHWVHMTMHYLKYPLLLWHLEFKPCNLKKTDNCSKDPSTKHGEAEANKMASNGSTGVTWNTAINVAGVAEKSDGLMQDPKLSSYILRPLHRILDELETANIRRGKEEEREMIATHWRNFAAMYDRILFLSFFICIISITAWFLTTSKHEDHIL